MYAYYSSCISDLGSFPVSSQKDKNLKMLEEENAQLSQTVADLKNQVTHASPTISPDSNNATRKLQDEINTLTKRNCGKSSLLLINHSINISVF